MWQDEQLVDAVNGPWSTLAPAHPVTVWQVPQFAEVVTCRLGLPVALVPLWHLAQLGSELGGWGNFDPDHVVTVWQVLQSSVVGTWLADFPRALEPLWQLAQTTLAGKLLWSTRAPLHLTVVWQVEQLA